MGASCFCFWRHSQGNKGPEGRRKKREIEGDNCLTSPYGKTQLTSLLTRSVSEFVVVAERDLKRGREWCEGLPRRGESRDTHERLSFVLHVLLRLRAPRGVALTLLHFNVVFYLRSFALALSFSLLFISSCYNIIIILRAYTKIYWT